MSADGKNICTSWNIWKPSILHVRFSLHHQEFESSEFHKCSSITKVCDIYVLMKHDRVNRWNKPSVLNPQKFELYSYIYIHSKIPSHFKTFIATHHQMQTLQSLVALIIHMPLQITQHINNQLIGAMYHHYRIEKKKVDKNQDIISSQHIFHTWDIHKYL